MRPSVFLNRPRPRPPTDGAYAPEATLQWWYFDAVLNNGGRFLTFFLPKMQGSIDGNEPDQPMVDIVLRKPDGETVRERRFFRPSEFVASEEGFEASFGQACSLRFEKEAGQYPLGRFLLKARAGRLNYDLELVPELPPWAPTSASGRFPRIIMALARRSLFTQDYFHYVPLVPRGSLVGRITTDGESLDARGVAYHEQGRLNFRLAEFMPAWYWLHIEHEPWTILSGTAAVPHNIPLPLREPRGGMMFVQRDNRCLMAAFDPTGLLINWDRIVRRDSHAEPEGSMAWESTVRFMRPGLRGKMRLTSRNVLTYVPFEYHERTRTRPYWGQTVADAEIEIVHNRERTRFKAEALLETMVTGA